MNAHEIHGDETDVRRVARQVLNHTIGEKMISKQEAMVHIGQLDLFHCSESIETHSLSGFRRLVENDTDKSSGTTLLAKYANRSAYYKNKSLYEFFFCTKPNPQEARSKYVPHFVGASSTPVYPLREPYALSMLLLHIPWNLPIPFTKESAISEFKKNFTNFPVHVTIPFQRIKARRLHQNMDYEPTNSNNYAIGSSFASNSIPDDLNEIIQLASTLPRLPLNDDDLHDVDFGLSYPWHIPQVNLPMSFEKTIKFLSDQTEQFELSKKTGVSIPKRSNGKDYAIQFLRPDQKDIMAVVVETLYRWVYQEDFVPLRMTVSGVAGSGKSTLIQTIVSTVRNIFQRNDVIHVCAPTGSAAFSAGGETIHRLFRIRVNAISENLTSAVNKTLKSKFSNLIVLIVDERSMLQSELLGVMEAYSRLTVHGGLNHSKPWGQIPIILLVGDDYQLPPINKGAFDSFIDLQSKIEEVHQVKSTNANKRIARGHHQFQDIGKKVMYLKKSVRQHDSQHRLQSLLQGLRGENDENLSEDDIEFLATNFHLMSPHFSEDDRKELCKDALFLFANKKPKQLFNDQKLRELQSPTNPVARIKSETINNHGKIVSNNKHYDNETTANVLCICIGASVALSGCNICPEWGLFNASVGKVVDIVFHEGQNPNDNQLPAYVLVEFGLYQGPVFDPDNRHLIPITPITIGCNNFGCCNRKFIPLKLAFAKTCHTFQGQSAGPVEKDQPPNPVKRIICDPGTRQFEGQNVGLFYTILSRATTLGDNDSCSDKDKFKNSAIYFIGSNMNKSRITNITKQQNGEKYSNVLKRERWVRYLKEHETFCTLPQSTIQDLFDWASTARIQYETLKQIIVDHASQVY